MCANFTSLNTFKDFICKAIGILKDIIPVLILLATVIFLWGVIQFILAADNEKEREEKKQFIIYGLIGLFVIVAVWGLVNVLLYTFFGANPPGLPLGPEI
ncbi:MAG: hypothetical protein HYW71_01320 [Candidatus Niyogibacteria bacterium]|nr:hypothetical protein [Candidatus Niyogibacteria bacterium]